MPQSLSLHWSPVDLLHTSLVFLKLLLVTLNNSVFLCIFLIKRTIFLRHYNRSCPTCTQWYRLWWTWRLRLLRLWNLYEVWREYYLVVEHRSLGLYVRQVQRSFMAAKAVRLTQGRNHSPFAYGSMPGCHLFITYIIILSLRLGISNQT